MRYLIVICLIALIVLIAYLWKGKIERLIKLTKKIESLLEKIGARGRGLHEKTDSIAHLLDHDIISKLHYIATIRNKAVHEDKYKIDDFEGFKANCYIVIQELKKIKKSNRS